MNTILLLLAAGAFWTACSFVIGTVIGRVADLGDSLLHQAALRDIRERRGGRLDG